MSSLNQNIHGLLKNSRTYQKIFLLFLICGFVTGTAGALLTPDFSERTSVITGSGMDPVVQNNQLPVAMIRVDSESGPAPLTVTFDGSRSYDPDGVITNFRWEFPDGTIGSGSSVSHTFLSPGTQSVQLVVTDGRGSSSGPAYTNIHVESGPGVVQGNSGETGLVVIGNFNRKGITGREIAVRTDQTLVSVIEHNQQGSATTDGTLCDDGDACTINDVISSGICTGGIATNCDDDDPGTTDTCDSSSGCVHSPLGGKVVVIQGGRTEENYEGRSPGVRVLRQEREGDIPPPDDNSGITVKSLGKTDPGSDPIGGVVSFVFGIFSLGATHPPSGPVAGNDPGTIDLNGAVRVITCPESYSCLNENLALQHPEEYSKFSDDACSPAGLIIPSGSGSASAASYRCLKPECLCISEKQAQERWGTSYERCDESRYCELCFEGPGTCGGDKYKFEFRKRIIGSIDFTENTGGKNTVKVGDRDKDSIADFADNCPTIYNPEQRDTDIVRGSSHVSSGQVIPGLDEITPDGVGDSCDNCPAIPNEDQADTDSDGVGDICDNCPTVANKDQKASDSDSEGDACDKTPFDSYDEDWDGDTVGNSRDNCRNISNLYQEDQDRDGEGDKCDVCPSVEYLSDLDEDCIPVQKDNCPDVANKDQNDKDGDKYGDACDTCPDLPVNQKDTDKDGVGDECDDTQFTIRFYDSIYTNGSNTPPYGYGISSKGQYTSNADNDDDGLKDAYEDEIGKKFNIYLIFDSHETARRPDEPITVFQVRPVGCSGEGCTPPYRIKVMYKGIFFSRWGIRTC